MTKLNKRKEEKYWKCIEGSQEPKVGHLGHKRTKDGTQIAAPMLWPPDAKSRPIGKDPDAGKD